METIAQTTAQGPLQHIRVKLVTTALNGERRSKSGIEATTFEHVLDFGDADFDSEQGRKRVAEAALASAAFPGLFVPVQIAGVGPCVDGGAVNNATISWAIDLGADHVIIVTGDPLHTPIDHELGGLELLGKEVDIAINERLFRDLGQARRVNQKLDELDAALQRLSLDGAQRTQIFDVLGWKKLRITEIRPTRPLPGNAFSALGSPELRSQYIELGREAAERAL
jgi:NTE family protein